MKFVYFICFKQSYSVHIRFVNKNKGDTNINTHVFFLTYDIYHDQLNINIQTNKYDIHSNQKLHLTHLILLKKTMDGKNNNIDREKTKHSHK